MLGGGVGEFLSNDVRAIACKEGSYRPLGLRVRALDVFQVSRLVAVGLVVIERGVGTEAVLVDVEVDGFCQHAVPADVCCVGNTTDRTGGLVGDDVDDACDSIAAVERGGSPVEHLDTLHTGVTTNPVKSNFSPIL